MEHSRYNPATDRFETRIAKTGPKGIYHVDVPFVEGASYRRAREAAQAALEQAIRAGQPPGEVSI